MNCLNQSLSLDPLFVFCGSNQLADWEALPHMDTVSGGSDTIVKILLDCLYKLIMNFLERFVKYQMAQFTISCDYIVKLHSVKLMNAFLTKLGHKFG